MQDVAFGTAASVPPDQILTPFWTFGVIQTLVGVNTVSTSRI
jgi:hypothetical protein